MIKFTYRHVVFYGQHNHNQYIFFWHKNTINYYKVLLSSQWFLSLFFFLRSYIYFHKHVFSWVFTSFTLTEEATAHFSAWNGKKRGKESEREWKRERGRDGGSERERKREGVKREGWEGELEKVSWKSLRCRLWCYFTYSVPNSVSSGSGFTFQCELKDKNFETFVRKMYSNNYRFM